jgi:alpha-L-fucosidase 2
MFSCNQVDLMEPYVRYIKAFAPRARWLAKKTYGLEGLFLPVNIFGPEHLVAPKDAQSKNARQIAYVPWTYGLGLTGWGLQNLWLRYKYQPDLEYLKTVYPLLRDGAEFYANVIQQCSDDNNDGKVEIGPSYNPEHGPFGSFNNPVDIAYFRFLLETASEAAQLLNQDEKQVKRWQDTRAVLPDYETALLDGEPIIANWKGAAANAVPVHNVASPTVPVFPAEQITWFSPAEEKAVFKRTLQWIKHNGNNSHIMVNVAKARLSMPEAYSETRAHFSRILTSNGLYAGWPGHGYYLAESWAFAGLTAELLLQSVDDIIRVFPAWPGEYDARFTDLRAQGGFLVSAAQTQKKTVSLVVKSTVGGPLRILCPWEKGIEVDGHALTTDAHGIVTLATESGQTLVFTGKD